MKLFAFINERIIEEIDKTWLFTTEMFKLFLPAFQTLNENIFTLFIPSHAQRLRSSIYFWSASKDSIARKKMLKIT